MALKFIIKSAVLFTIISITLLSCISFNRNGIPKDYSLVFRDDFDQPTLNTDNWTIGLIDPETGDIVPGAKGQYLLNFGYAGYITEEDTYVRDGYLHLLNHKRTIQGIDPGNKFKYTSGWVMSMHKVYANKGYWEMRAKFPKGDAVWPAFWLISEELVWGPEWDMFEYFGSRRPLGLDLMGMHLCYDAFPSEKWSSHWIRKFDETYDNEEWHIYGFEWTEDKAVWRIDGKIVRTLINEIGDLWPDEDMYMVINNGVRTASSDKDTVYPNDFVIDYVAYYSK